MRRARTAGERWIVARPVLQFAAVGLAAVVIVGLALSVASRRVGEREAISDARSTTIAAVQGVIEPVVTDGLLVADPAAVAAVADVVEGQLLDDALVRVKIWTRTGRIVYSDEARLEGTTYELAADDVEALDEGRIEAEVSDLTRPENRFERSFGKLLEVYLPLRTPSGDRLLFEAYYRYDAVEASGSRIWRSFAPIAIGALVLLEVVQIPLAWSLASRLRHRQREREELLRRALDASDVERRRIATDLHDGVVQDLAGVAYSLAAGARAGGSAASQLDDSASSVRAAITGLRSVLLDLYPPALAEAGLAAALGDLVASGATGTVAVDLDTEALTSPVPPAPAALLFRAARELIRNATEHASAQRIDVVAGSDAERAWLEVRDDGIGFDEDLAAAKADEGHLGLRSIRDLARDAGGAATISTGGGTGTSVRVEVPNR